MDDPVSILSPRQAVTLSTQATVADAIDVMLRGQIGAVVIVDEQGTAVGIFSERDLLMKLVGQCENYSIAYVRDYMTPAPVTVRETDTLAFALHKMAIGGYRHVPVVSEGRLTGVVSVRDMLAHITQICDRPAPGVLSDP